MKVRRARPVELLRLLLMASIVFPVLLFAAVGWITYQAAWNDAQHDLNWTSEVAREHAAKVFDSYKLVADRVSDLLGPYDVAGIRASEDRLSKEFKAIITGLSQIESLIVLDRTGHLLVATEANPVDPSTDFSDRDYFKALHDSSVMTFISRVLTSRVTGKTFFGWGRALRGSDGAFAGVIDIAVSPHFLQSFYATLIDELGQSPDGWVVTMIRADGQILVRQPGFAGPQPLVPPNNPFFAAIQANPAGGTYTSRSLIDPGAPKRLFAFRKVPGHPIYIVAGRSISAIRAEWALAMLHYLAFGIPGTAAIFLITLATWRSAGRERQALAQLREEMGRRERVEGQLRQAQKMEAIGQLTGGIAHDFNNLLTVIRSSVDLLRRPNLTEERRSRYVAAISDTTDRAARLTGQLLAFARRQALKPEVFNVVESVAPTVEMLRALIGSRISVETLLPDEALFINADPSQFDACLVNLAVNARDAMDGQGHLCVSMEAVDGMPALRGSPAVSGEHVALSVSDTGTGIAADDLETVFEPFFTTKRKGEGTGLGLSQVFGFTTQSGGGVAVTSMPGRGTTFTLYLPRVASPAVEIEEAVTHRNEPDLAGLNVLVVDDDPAVGAAVIEVLGDLGYATVLTTDAKGALSILSDSPNHFDVVLSDVVMPGMSGIELGQEIRRSHVDLPVVLTSGYSEVLAQNGTYGFELLHKPYSAEDLSQTLRRATQWRRRRRSLR